MSWGYQGGVFITGSGMPYTQHAHIWSVIRSSCIGYSVYAVQGTKLLPFDMLAADGARYTDSNSLSSNSLSTPLGASRTLMNPIKLSDMLVG